MPIRRPPSNHTVRNLLLLAGIVIILGAQAVRWLERPDRHDSQPHPATAPASLPAPEVAVGGTPDHITWCPTARGTELKVLDKGWFTIGYDERSKNPVWVSYTLTGPIRYPGPEPTRPQTFTTDFATAAHVSHHDYTGSGFDRGHLCPAYAMWSRHASAGFLATFVCSNVIPQPHTVNAGIWEELETDIAGRWSSHGGQSASGGWAERFGEVTVINGPIYGSASPALRNGTLIPAVDFSVVIRHDSGQYQALAFEIPNTGDPRGPLDRYLVSIKRVEDDAHLDLFAGQAASLRPGLETSTATAMWR